MIILVILGVFITILLISGLTFTLLDIENVVKFKKKFGLVHHPIKYAYNFEKLAWSTTEPDMVDMFMSILIYPYQYIIPKIMLKGEGFKKYKIE